MPRAPSCLLEAGGQASAATGLLVVLRECVRWVPEVRRSHGDCEEGGCVHLSFLPAVSLLRVWSLSAMAQAQQPLQVWEGNDLSMSLSPSLLSHSDGGHQEAPSD